MSSDVDDTEGNVNLVGSSYGLQATPDEGNMSQYSAFSQKLMVWLYIVNYQTNRQIGKQVELN